MISHEVREQLQNIIRGELQKGQIDSCTAIRNILCESFGTSPTVKSEFESRAILKEKQITFVKSYAEIEGLWLESIPSGYLYLTEGGESKVYLSGDGRSVIKINDAGYYATWTEYFNSLLLHNLIFSETALIRRFISSTSELSLSSCDDAILPISPHPSRIARKHSRA
jgi:Serine/Threonine/Tyrosine Kinase found in polyvalent proteins